MNLLATADALKNLSDTQLRQAYMGGTVPQFIVLTEMNRRQGMRAEYQNRDPQNAKDTSLADQLLAGIGQLPTSEQIAANMSLSQTPPGAPPGAPGLSQNAQPGNTGGSAGTPMPSGPGGYTQQAPPNPGGAAQGMAMGKAKFAEGGRVGMASGGDTYPGEPEYRPWMRLRPDQHPDNMAGWVPGYTDQLPSESFDRAAPNSVRPYNGRGINALPVASWGNLGQTSSGIFPSVGMRDYRRAAAPVPGSMDYAEGLLAPQPYVPMVSVRPDIPQISDSIKNEITAANPVPGSMDSAAGLLVSQPTEEPPIGGVAPPPPRPRDPQPRRFYSHDLFRPYYVRDNEPPTLGPSGPVEGAIPTSTRENDTFYADRRPPLSSDERDYDRNELRENGGIAALPGAPRGQGSERIGTSPVARPSAGGGASGGGRSSISVRGGGGAGAGIGGLPGASSLEDYMKQAKAQMGEHYKDSDTDLKEMREDLKQQKAEAAGNALMRMGAAMMQGGAKSGNFMEVLGAGTNAGLTEAERARAEINRAKQGVAQAAIARATGAQHGDTAALTAAQHLLTTDKTTDAQKEIARINAAVHGASSSNALRIAEMQIAAGKFDKAMPIAMNIARMAGRDQPNADDYNAALPFAYPSYGVAGIRADANLAATRARNTTVYSKQWEDAKLKDPRYTQSFDDFLAQRGINKHTMLPFSESPPIKVPSGD